MKPESLGRYQILGQLATGGMAEILLGRVVGPSGFERPVVVKRILRHLASQAAFVDMFLDEARIAAGIRHPNVVQVQELSQEGSDLFLVMEYLEGESVSGLMKRLVLRGQTLSFDLAAYVVAEACAGLHAAHELTNLEGIRADLVHRDISPQNIFVTYDGHVKILDFGIAKAADRSTRTEAGQVKGKFEYMSPEQCRGLPLDRRSDIFALGVVLYELTTARRLFKRGNHLNTLKAICYEPVLPPSRLLPDYPSALEKVCLRALQHAPDDRYVTAADMRRDLLAIVRGSATEPTTAVADLMRSLFEDRMEEKRELLRKMRSGSDLTSVPAGEVDETIEVPMLPDEIIATGTALRTTVDAEPARPRTALYAALALAIGAAGALATTTLSRRAPDANATVPATSAPELVVSSAPVVVTSKAPAEAASITVHIDTQPPGAQVFVVGERRGTTPLELTLPRTNTNVVLEIRKPGFAAAKETVVADSNQRLRIALHPAAATKTATSAAKPSDSGFLKWN